MPISKDFIHLSGIATIEEALQAFLDRDGQWWWLLVVENEGECFICTFGSLLPYLAGRTSHIVHQVGDCAICSAMDPVLWTETGPLVEAVLADQKILQQVISDLPMAELPVVNDPSEEIEIIETMMIQKVRACGVRTGGEFSGVYIIQVKGDLGGPPQF